jgi:hypothetical protein
MLVGSTRPRLFTAPLRPLNRRTSAGYAVLDWLERELGWTPMPWQRWLIQHLYELNADGSRRFRQVLLLVARQNGKTELVTMLALYELAHGAPMILGTSGSGLDTAKEAWELAVEIAQARADLFGRCTVRRANGNHQLITDSGKFKVVSSSRRGGRGLTVRLLLLDELREHLTWDAYSAAEGTTTAAAAALTLMTSNAGDDRSVVLAHFRALGISGAQPDFGLFEWSAPDGAELTDRRAWAAANPALGTTITEASLASKLSGPAAIFRTEHLCQHVPSTDEVISAASWSNCLDVGDLAEHRSRVVAFLDVAQDLRHSTLVAAAVLPDGRVRLEVVAAWSSTTQLRAELPELLARVRPRRLGWFAGSPAAGLGLELAKVKGRVELSARAQTAACQQLAELAQAGRLAQSGDELLTAHVLSVRKQPVGDGYRFGRGDGHADAALSAAGAAHLARQLPVPAKLTLVT